MIVQESARGMTQVKGSEKVPTTPTMPTARRQDLHQERPSTRNIISGVTTHFGQSTLGT